MPEVIVDTSPLQYLHQTGHLALLQEFYGQITVPRGVASELDAGRALGLDLPSLSDLSWVNVQEVHKTGLVALAAGLGTGEREVLAIAVDVSDAVVVLDDALARRYARLLDLKLTGTLGILLRAKREGVLRTIAPEIDRLTALGFRLADRTRREVMRLAGE